jgi:hypothetical protein
MKTTGYVKLWVDSPANDGSFCEVEVFYSRYFEKEARYTSDGDVGNEGCEELEMESYECLEQPTPEWLNEELVSDAFYCSVIRKEKKAKSLTLLEILDLVGEPNIINDILDSKKENTK